jgi:hypothetical protein
LRADTISKLQEQFRITKIIGKGGGKANVKKEQTQTSVKDTYQDHYLSLLTDITSKRGRTPKKKEEDLDKLLQSLLNYFEKLISPVWRLEGK